MLVFLGLLVGGPVARAQDFGAVEETNTNVTSYFYFTQPGEATIEVKVMGTVLNPGLYVLSEDTDLGQLLALSGGPTLDPRQRSTERTAIVRLFRPQASGQTLLYEAEFEGGAITEPGPYPALQDGDVLTVEVLTDEGFTWRDVFTVANTVALIGLTVVRFFE